MPKKRGSQGKRYSAEQKAKILATAKKEGLTGAEVRKRFGVSTLSFYRWRGPVSRRKKHGSGRPKGRANARVNPTVVREAVRAQIERMLPRIIQEEVAAALKG